MYLTVFQKSGHWQMPRRKRCPNCLYGFDKDIRLSSVEALTIMRNGPKIPSLSRDW